jgi:DNA invertase Pin-like site-specific DNA recombinase
MPTDRRLYPHNEESQQGFQIGAREEHLMHASVFNVIGTMAEFERALIQERVRAGLRNARRKGTPIDQPKIAANGHEVARPLRAGRSWREICRQTGLSNGTAQRAYCAQKGVPDLPKNRCAHFSPGV